MTTPPTPLAAVIVEIEKNLIRVHNDLIPLIPIFTSRKLSEAIDALSAAAEQVEKMERENERLKKAIEKVISYNRDIQAERINYRPEDHIEILNAALWYDFTPPTPTAPPGVLDELAELQKKYNALLDDNILTHATLNARNREVGWESLRSDLPVTPPGVPDEVAEAAKRWGQNRYSKLIDGHHWETIDMATLANYAAAHLAGDGE